MTLLRNQPVNPLNNPTVAAPAAPVEQPIPPVASYEEPQTTGYLQPAANALPAVTPLPVQASQFNDGFDDLDDEIGFGSFSRVKLDSGIFWFDEDKMGSEFTCNIFQVKKVYIHRSKEEGSDAQAVWSYEDITKNPNAVTTAGEPVAQVIARWKAEGHSPVVRNTLEAAAMIIGGEHDGAVAMLAIPQTSAKKFAGYSKVLGVTKGRRVPQVITKVGVGSPIKTGTRTFQPWTFEAVGDYQPQNQAA